MNIKIEKKTPNGNSESLKNLLLAIYFSNKHDYSMFVLGAILSIHLFKNSGIFTSFLTLGLKAALEPKLLKAFPNHPMKAGFKMRNMINIKKIITVLI